MSSAQNEYIFQVSLPALGYSTYYFQATNNDHWLIDGKKIEPEQVITTSTNEACILQNQYLRVEFNDRGDLKRIVNLAKNLTVSFTEQGLYWYAGKE